MNVIDTDARFVIDPVSGEITNQSLKETIARGSHNSEVFTFEIPRNIGHDPCECNLIEIHYLNINARNKTETSEGIYKVNDIHGEDDATATFTWTIDGSASVFAGTLSFSIHFKCIDSEGKCLYRLPIKTYSKITVTDAIDNSGVVMEDNKDIIAEWEARISALEENGGGGGSNEVLFVKVVYDTLEDPGNQYSTTHTSRQIYDHVLGGGAVVLKYDFTGDEYIFNLSQSMDGYAVFYSVDSMTDGIGNGNCYEVIRIEGSIVKHYYVPFCQDVRDQLGDISTALDHIIEIQEELIGA